MKPEIRRAYGTPPASGHRFERREVVALPAALHVDGAHPLAVTIADLTPRGCRALVVTDLRVAAHVALMLDGASLVSGRVAWNDGTGIGIDFCAALLPRTVARLLGGAIA
jgi:hypothetical protein